MSAQKPEFVPQLVPPWQRIPDPCPQHPNVSMERIVERGELHYRCPVCATSGRMQAIPATPILRDREPGRLFLAWCAAHPGVPRIPEEQGASAALPQISEAQIQAVLSPDFKPVRLPRLTNAQRVQAWETFETRREPLQDAWLNSGKVAEVEVFGTPERPEDSWERVEQPSAELLLSELAEGNDEHTETNIRAIRRRSVGKLSGSLSLESEERHESHD